MKVIVKELNEFTAGIVCRYPQDDRINYLYRLLEFNAESELNKKLVEKVKKGLFPNNIYDVDLDLIDGSIATMYNKYNAIKYTDGVAKIAKCSKCGKEIPISFSRLVRLRNMADKHKNTCMITTCNECKGKKMKEFTKPKKKKPDNEVKVEMKIQDDKKNLNNRIYPKPEIKVDMHKKKSVSEVSISTRDILEDALKEIKLSAEISARHPGKPVITSVSSAKPSRKVSIHEEIAPMRGNSLGNLLKDIKV